MTLVVLVNGVSQERDAATTQAVVLSREQRVGAEGNDFFLTYEFRPPQQGLVLSPSFRKAVSVDYLTYVTHPPKTRAVIRFSKVDPHRSWLALDFSVSSIVRLAMMGIFSIFAVGLPLLGLLGFVQTGFELWRLVLMTCCAQQAQALVLARWGETSVEGSELLYVGYGFPLLPDGTHYAAELNHNAYHKFKVNDAVRVRYVPRHPSICKLQF
jgi:hypothetical protein